MPSDALMSWEPTETTLPFLPDLTSGISTTVTLNVVGDESSRTFVSVAEPATAAFLATGLAALAGRTRRRPSS